jgi:murein L,D-transpeptidase YafK
MKYIVWSIIIITLSLATYYFIHTYQRTTSKEIPQKEIEAARSRLLKAKKVNADIYAKPQFQLAQNYYDSALKYWKTENERFFLFRKYQKAKRAAHIADSLASKAISITHEISTDSKSFTANQIKTIKGNLEILQSANSHFKLPDDLNSGIRKIAAELPELEIQFQKENWKKCTTLATSLAQRSTLMMTKSREYLTNYFSHYDQWQKWATTAIKKSRSGKISTIVVDKTAGECFMYQNGKKIATYKAELGQNWTGTKRFEGDKSTPEGNYTITLKKQGKSTKYYKALKINYPNEEDKNRFESLKRDGHIDQKKRIGGMIEIHGDGGKGYHWTDGCIALTNKDMDQLYSKASVNTPVVIVGSLKPLKEILTF